MMTYTKIKYSIGELSRISSLSKRNLRFYDEKKLLQPAMRDPKSNYRYYAQEQVLDAIMIHRLRKSGLNLSDLKEIMLYRDVDCLKENLQGKIETLEEEISALISQKQSCQDLVNSIDVMSEFLTNKHKPVEQKLSISLYSERFIISKRENCKLETKDLFWERHSELVHYIEAHQLEIAGNFTAIFHDHYYNHFSFQFGDLEVFFPIHDSKQKDLTTVKTFGGFLTASVVFVGKYENLFSSYVKLLNFIHENHYKIVGPSFEEYISDFSLGIKEDQWVTRVYFPIKKLSSFL